VEDLVELQHRDRIRLVGIVRLHELFGIERLAHKNVQDLAGTRDAVARNLRVVDVELRFAVGPVAVVLEKRGRELGKGAVRNQEEAEEWQTNHRVPLFRPMAQDQEHDHDQVQTGVANPAVIDLFGLDEKTGEVVLAMREPRPWDGSDERLHHLQEKFNAYVSFLLDGEMNAAHPELAGKRARIELRCDHMPDERALELLNLIHDQIALQEIRMEVVVRQAGCAHDCSCHTSAE